jgi:hypothetical protein
MFNLVKILFYTGELLIDISFLILGSRFYEIYKNLYSWFVYQICRVVTYLLLLTVVSIPVWVGCEVYVDLFENKMPVPVVRNSRLTNYEVK